MRSIHNNLNHKFANRLILSLLLICLGLATGMARHIIGGEMTYRCIGENGNSRQYEVTMNLYRDCGAVNGAPFDDDAVFGIFRWDSTRYYFVDKVSQHRGSIRSIQPVDDACVVIPPNVCVEGTSYTFQISLPVINGSYFITHQRCCRNETIANIVNPGAYGATYMVEITAPAQQFCNNSPAFKNFPPIVICVNDDIDFDHSAADRDGDQLVYEFCAPIAGGGRGGSNGFPGMETDCDGVKPSPVNCPPPYPNVIYNPQYNVSSPMSGDPVVSINPNTGLITGRPDIFGQFVVGVCVTEYRNGVRIGAVQRDFQFNVTQCQNLVRAQVEADTIIQKNYVINSCGSFTVDFLNQSYQADYIKSYDWEFDIGGQKVRNTSRDASFTFPGLGNFIGKMVLNRGSQCADSLDLTVNVYPDLSVDFQFAYDTCIAGETAFTDLSKTGAAGGLQRWSWQFGEGGTSTTKNPRYTYPVPGTHPVTLTVVDANQCKESLTKDLPYYPVPRYLVIEPSSYLGCVPGNIFFNNLSVPIDSTYEINWDFGDGTVGHDISPSHIYESPGTFDVSLQLVSPIGCKTQAMWKDWIVVKESPQAGFKYNPDEPSNLEPVVNFTDESQRAARWFWQFGAEGTSTLPNPQYNFQDTGTYLVRQIVIHSSGCTDTATAEIDVKPIVRYFLPNAFTPNGDGTNEIYIGQGNTEWMFDYSFSIWNRWGQRIFETSDPYEGWNGRMNNVGEDAPNGVYVCLVRYTDPRGNAHEVKGFATVVR